MHSDSAVLHAQINPGGGDTTYHFEYGSSRLHRPIPTPAQAFRSPTPMSAPGWPTQNATHASIRPRWRAPPTTGASSPQMSPAPPTATDHTFTTFPYEHRDRMTPAQTPTSASRPAPPCCSTAAPMSSSPPPTPAAMTSSRPRRRPDPLRRLPRGREPVRASSTASTTAASPAPATRPTQGPDPYVATRGDEAGRPNTSASPLTTPSPPSPSPRPPPAPTRASKPSPSAAPTAARPALKAATPASRSACQTANWCRAWPARSNPAPRAKPDGYIAKDLSANGEHFIFGSTSQFADRRQQRNRRRLDL